MPVRSKNFKGSYFYFAQELAPLVFVPGVPEVFCHVGIDLDEAGTTQRIQATYL
jgi:hypothetical protein